MLIIKMSSAVVAQKARDMIRWDRKDEESLSRLYRIVDMIDHHEYFLGRTDDILVDVDEELYKFLEF